MWTFNLPLRVQISKNKHFALNLNQYRNEYYQTLNKAKINFDKIVRILIQDLPVLDRVRIHYVLYMPTNREADTANICCIVDKFFCDTLVSSGRLRDDNYNLVPGVTFEFGGVDRGNPRVEATIEPLGSEEENPASCELSRPKENNLKITIVQNEIEAAIRSYIRSQITVNDGMEINMDLRATRGDEGFMAHIDIVAADPQSAAQETAPAVTQATQPVVRRPLQVVKPTPVLPSVLDEPEVKTAQAQTVSEEASTIEADAAEAREELSQVRTTSLFRTAAIAEPEPDGVEENEAEAPLKPSIFSGLRRPVNEPALAEA